MVWMLCGTAVLMYVAGSYYLMFKMLSSSAGPAGLGWLVFPFAPLIPLFMIGAAVKSFWKKIFR